MKRCLLTTLIWLPPCWSRRFYSPDWAVFKELCLRSQCGWRLTFHTPYMCIGWRLVHDRCSNFSQTAQLYFHEVTSCPECRSCYEASFFSLRRNGKFDNARLGPRRDHGHFCLFPAGTQVLDDGQYEAVRQVGWKIHMRGFHFLLISIF